MTRRKQARPKALKGGEDSDDASDIKTEEDQEMVDDSLDVSDELSAPTSIDQSQTSSPKETEGRASRSSGSSSPGGTDEKKSGTFPCTYCSDSFSQPGQLKIHEQVHAALMPYRCRHCGKGFKHKRSQDRHEQLHTGYKKHKCNQCDAAFFRSDHLKLHLRTHDGNRSHNNGSSPSFMTPGADTDGGSQRSLDGPAMTKCAVCSKSFAGPEELLNHMDQDHDVMRMPPNIGAMVIKSELGRATPSDFGGDASRDSHVASSAQPVIACGLCQRRFDDVQQLQKHTLQSHSVHELHLQVGGQPISRRSRGFDSDPRYVCSHCDKSCDSILALHKHTASAHENLQSDSKEESSKTPTDQKESSYVCGQCHTEFPDFPSFGNHMRQHLNQESEENTPPPLKIARISACDLCGLECKNQMELDSHLLSHYLQKEANFSCGSCQKSFGVPDELQKHLLEIHALHVFKCALCKELFESRVDIQVHFAVVHSKQNNNWRCRSCNALFDCEDQFKTHMEVVHLKRPLLEEVWAQLKNGPESLQTCTVCLQNFTTMVDLKEHMTKHGLFNCSFCPENFSVEFLFERHMESVHPGQTYSVNPRKINQISTTPDFMDHKSLPTFATYGFTGFDGLVFPQQAGQLKCNICDRKCDSVTELSEHKLQHCKVVVCDTCYVCHDSIPSLEQFYKHTRQHTESNGVPVSCVICRQSLTSPVELQVHARFHLNLGAQENGIKLSVNGSDSPIEVHSEESTESSLTCKDCLVSFNSKDEKETHIKSAHPKPFQCIKCQKQFATETEIHQHVATHVLKDGVDHHCKLCQQVFDSPAKLQCHLIEHSFAGCTEFQCYLCGVLFSLPQPLLQHMLSHGSDERPYGCQECQQTFFFRAELENHTASLHPKRIQNGRSSSAGTPAPHTPRQPTPSHTPAVTPSTPIRVAEVDPDKFPCPKCPKVFNSLSALQGHSHVHMTNRTHHCLRCNRSFPTATKLRNHQRQHSGDKPFPCQDCGRYFSRKDNLKVHQKLHCRDCGGNEYEGEEEYDSLPTMVSSRDLVKIKQEFPIDAID